jgi:hypothetical protein
VSEGKRKDFGERARSLRELEASGEKARSRGKTPRRACEIVSEGSRKESDERARSLREEARSRGKTPRRACETVSEGSSKESDERASCKKWWRGSTVA